MVDSSLPESQSPYVQIVLLAVRLAEKAAVRVGGHHVVHKLDSRPNRMWGRVDMVLELALAVIFAIHSAMVW